MEGSFRHDSKRALTFRAPICLLQTDLQRLKGVYMEFERFLSGFLSFLILFILIEKCVCTMPTLKQLQAELSAPQG